MRLKTGFMKRTSLLYFQSGSELSRYLLEIISCRLRLIKYQVLLSTTVVLLNTGFPKVRSLDVSFFQRTALFVQVRGLHERAPDISTRFLSRLAASQARRASQ